MPDIKKKESNKPENGPKEKQAEDKETTSQPSLDVESPSDRSLVQMLTPQAGGPDVSKKDVRDQFKESHNYIKDRIVNGSPPSEAIDISQPILVSKVALDDYVTLDWRHYEEIKKVMEVIRSYATDRSRKRPLNIIMQAEPGSGKSHFITCLARKMSDDGISAVTFNMASFHDLDDFVQPLEAVRNLKVVDKVPLLFLDEFDSSENNYALLLPLLWDGELSVGQRQLRTGKIVIVLAGSGSQIGEVMKNSKTMLSTNQPTAGKLTDLLSRINGGELSIPGLDEVVGDRDRRVDKVCLTLSLLKRRFGDSLAEVPWAFLKFIAETKFRYGVRSVSHLIDLIPSKEAEPSKLLIKDLQLPISSVPTLKGSSLPYHLIAEDGPAAIIEAWKTLKANEVLVRFEGTWSSLIRMFRWAND